MPIGGSNVGWDNTAPQDTDNAGSGDDEIRSLKTSLQQAIDNEHNFSSGGGANTGYHRFGSARPYYGVQSAVSSSGSDGRLMLTSDTSRLFGVGSGGTVFLGGWGTLSVDSTTDVSWPQRARWACEFGHDTTDASGLRTITIPNSGFSGVPFVFLLRTDIAGASSRGATMADNITATSFRVRTFDTGGAAVAGLGFDWFSIGTRVL